MKRRFESTLESTRKRCRYAVVRQFDVASDLNPNSPAMQKWLLFEECLCAAFVQNIFQENLFLYDAMRTAKAVCAKYVIGAADWPFLEPVLRVREQWPEHGISDIGAIVAPRRFGKTTTGIVAIWAVCAAIPGTVVCFFGNGMRLCQAVREAFVEMARRLGSKFSIMNKDRLSMLVDTPHENDFGCDVGQSSLLFFPESVNRYVFVCVCVCVCVLSAGKNFFQELQRKKTVSCRSIFFSFFLTHTSTHKNFVYELTLSVVCPCNGRDLEKTSQFQYKEQRNTRGYNRALLYR